MCCLLISCLLALLSSSLPESTSHYVVDNMMTEVTCSDENRARRDLSFSMMSQHLLHASRATLEPTVYPLASGNNLADTHNQTWTHKCGHTLSNESANSHDKRIRSQMIKSLFAEADVVDSLGCCPTPFQQLLPPLKRLRSRVIARAKNAVIWLLDPASVESDDQVERLQICSRQHLLSGV